MLVKCACCEIEFNKMPSQIKRKSNNFCSRSCAAKINNKKYPKKERSKTCKGCQSKVCSGYTWCKSAIQEKKKKDLYLIKQKEKRLQIDTDTATSI